MTGQEQWEYLLNNKAEILAGRMIIDIFEFDDVKGCIQPPDEAEVHDDMILKVIAHLNEKSDPDHGITWSVIDATYDELKG